MKGIEMEPVTFILTKTIFLDDNKTLNPGTVIGTIQMEDIDGLHAPPRFLADGICCGSMVAENAMPEKTRQPHATAQTLGMPTNAGQHPDDQEFG